MPLNFARARPLLQQGKLKQLFVEELGWEPYRKSMDVPIGEEPIRLTGIAQKKGMVVWQCESPDSQLPDRATRLKLHRAVMQTTYEHLLVFVAGDRSCQSWMWVHREPGRPIRGCTHEYFNGQIGDALLQRLQHLFVSLEEEESGLSIAEVADRARTAFNVEPVVKKFYEQFRKEHAAFLKFISGITDAADREWYASVMLNRLMFVYFIQYKGFLDGDHQYLRNRLAQMQRNHGKDKFYSFYRYFLLRLFHEGLGKPKRPAELEKLVGKIPYLNGGIFDEHELERPERYGKDIQIPDKAFERVFDFFDRWRWHLDERPLREGNEINPDVLGYIYEKYINQKQMGAYYTKEDITEYISKNTVIPYLLDAARTKCRVAFENPNGPTVWDLLKNDPDRYIYPAVRHGVDQPLPKDIAKGVNPPTIHKPVGNGPVQTLELRKSWNKPAPPEYALPTEIWREVVARRQRCEEIRTKLLAGDVRDINDLVTLNLDIRQFAQDAIENCEGPDLLRAFWKSVEGISILDPTCGSGAFLFAALNILEPLYEACLDRMEAFLQDEATRATKKLKTTPHGYPLLPHGKFEDFSKVLDHVAAHPSRRYFIYKSVILNNLYGVDIMEEAVEICKLRLFLKLAAQVDPDAGKPNFGIEPLPDIDFNIRAGNTLVGFTSMEEIRRALGGDLVRQFDLPAIEEKSADTDLAFRRFREMQTRLGMDSEEFAEAKRELRRRLKTLNDELNQYLGADYGVNSSNRAGFQNWLKSHQPFHWFVEFYGTLSTGGFSAIIGNPPYVELTKIKEYSIRRLDSTVCGNLYCPMVERFTTLGSRNFRLGVIVPLSLSSTERTRGLRDILVTRLGTAWVSHYSGDAHPSKLFEGVKFRLDILIGQGGSDFTLFSSQYLKWFAGARHNLFSQINYESVPTNLWHLNQFPKIGTILGRSILSKLLSRPSLGLLLSQGGETVYVHRVITMFIKAFDFVPYFCSEEHGAKKSDDYKPFQFASGDQRDVVAAILNSSTFFLYFVILGDCFHCGKGYVLNFPFDFAKLSESMVRRFSALCHRLMVDLRNNAIRRRAVSGQTGAIEYDEFWPSKSKPIIDEIDHLLARHYGFTEEELDYIINYDIKYRMGRDGIEEDGD
ncbi:MAG: hypothetical protein AMXMBFR82_22010 [Candidatus Hydrogenedentota bacterium]